jgi:hypothetical protein
MSRINDPSSWGRILSSPADRLKSAAEKYVAVQPGESRLAQVAQRLNVTEAALRRVNPQIRDPLKLNVGQLLRLPDAAEISRSVASTAARASRETPSPEERLGVLGRKADFEQTGSFMKSRLTGVMGEAGATGAGETRLLPLPGHLLDKRISELAGQDVLDMLGQLNPQSVPGGTSVRGEMARRLQDIMTSLNVATPGAGGSSIASIMNGAVGTTAGAAGEAAGAVTDFAKGVLGLTREYVVNLFEGLVDGCKEVVQKEREFGERGLKLLGDGARLVLAEMKHPEELPGKVGEGMKDGFHILRHALTEGTRDRLVEVLDRLDERVPEFTRKVMEGLSDYMLNRFDLAVDTARDLLMDPAGTVVGAARPFHEAVHDFIEEMGPRTMDRTRDLVTNMKERFLVGGWERGRQFAEHLHSTVDNFLDKTGLGQSTHAVAVRAMLSAVTATAPLMEGTIAAAESSSLAAAAIGGQESVFGSLSTAGEQGRTLGEAAVAASSAFASCEAGLALSGEMLGALADKAGRDVLTGQAGPIPSAVQPEDALDAAIGRLSDATAAATALTEMSRAVAGDDTAGLFRGLQRMLDI